MDETLTILKDNYSTTNALQHRLLASLPLMGEAHKASKKDAFARNMPFYTCIDNENHWTKELQNGDKFLVARTFDWQNGEPMETVIEKLD